MRHARVNVDAGPRNAAHTCSYVCSAADGWAKLESLRKTKRWHARRNATRLASTCAGVRRSSASTVEHLAQARLGSTRGDKDAELAVVKHRVVGETAALVEDKDGHAAALEQHARTR